MNMTKSTMPPAAEIETITVEQYRMQQAEALAHDVFLQTESVLRMLGDSGGGKALARLITALYGHGAVLNFNDLRPLDSANCLLALSLIKEFLDELRTEDEWASLAELANRCAFSGE